MDTKSIVMKKLKVGYIVGTNSVNVVVMELLKEMIKTGIKCNVSLIVQSIGVIERTQHATEST